MKIRKVITVRKAWNRANQDGK